MGHRHFSNSFDMFGINHSQDSNHLSAEPSYVPIGAPVNGSFIPPMHNMSRSGVHSASQWNLEGRSTDYPSSNFSMEVQHFQPTFSVPPYDPYTHSPVAGNFYLSRESNAGLSHSYYSRQAIHDVDPTTGTVSGAFKRKSPGISGSSERGNTSTFYGAGSSSGSSQTPLEKPTPEYQSIPPGPINLTHYRDSGLSIATENSSRNVRSRSGFGFEPNTTRIQQSGYPSHLYHSATNLANNSGAVDFGNLNTDAASREWNCIPPLSAVAHGMAPSSDVGLGHETNAFAVGESSGDISGCHHGGSLSSRHHVSSSRYLHGPPTPSARVARSSHSRRAIRSYRTGLGYSHIGHEATSSDYGNSNSDSFSSRYSRPSFAEGWRNNHRSGRPRLAVDRLQSIPSVVNADSMGSEALMLDRASYYGSSRSLFDQYRDMRLDIDTMGYEELLALEERIGTVNTGVSEHMMSNCLIEKRYSSADQNHEEESCAICLEEYKDDQQLGTLKNCGHDYHVCCIRKWLVMKNVCPICKAAALSDSSN